MKRLMTILFLGLLALNVLTNFAVRVTSLEAARLWEFLLEGKALPQISVLAIEWGFVWPIVATVINCIALGLSFSSRCSERSLQILFGILVLGELACMSVHALALILPSVTATFGISA